LNYLAGAADDELREITQRNVEYRAGMAFIFASLILKALA
jgi:hypothetical protein